MLFNFPIYRPAGGRVYVVNQKGVGVAVFDIHTILRAISSKKVKYKDLKLNYFVIQCGVDQ